MNTNTDFTAIKAEPDAHREDEEEMLHTEIDADNPDRQENYFVQHYENNRTAGGKPEHLEAIRGDDRPHKNTRQTTQASRLSFLPTNSKKTRSNQQQMNMLIEFMENHPEFAAGRYLGPQVSHTSKALWEQLAEQLAEIGPAKSVDQLKTTWRDLKCKSRAKNAEAKRAALRTGSSSNVPLLADHTVKVINILGRAIADSHSLPESSQGDGPENSHGEGPELVLEVEYDQPSTSFSPASRPLSDPVAPSISCSGSDSGPTIRPEKRSRKPTASPEQVGNRTAKGQEAHVDPFNQLAIAVNRIGDIFERFTAAYIESVEMRRNRPRPKKRSTTRQGGQATYPSSDSGDG